MEQADSLLAANGWAAREKKNVATKLHTQPQRRRVLGRTRKAEAYCRNKPLPTRIEPGDSFLSPFVFERGECPLIADRAIEHDAQKDERER